MNTFDQDILIANKFVKTVKDVQGVDLKIVILENYLRLEYDRSDRNIDRWICFNNIIKLIYGSIVADGKEVITLLNKSVTYDCWCKPQKAGDNSAPKYYLRVQNNESNYYFYFDLLDASILHYGISNVLACNWQTSYYSSANAPLHEVFPSDVLEIYQYIIDCAGDHVFVILSEILREALRIYLQKQSFYTELGNIIDLEHSDDICSVKIGYQTYIKKVIDSVTQVSRYRVELPFLKRPINISEEYYNTYLSIISDSILLNSTTIEKALETSTKEIEESYESQKKRLEITTKKKREEASKQRDGIGNLVRSIQKTKSLAKMNNQVLMDLQN